MDQISGFYLAMLFMALVGILIFVNTLVGLSLRWVGRRVAAVWRRGGATDWHSSSHRRPSDPDA
jgi:hypothetical protein